MSRRSFLLLPALGILTLTGFTLLTLLTLLTLHACGGHAASAFGSGGAAGAGGSSGVNGGAGAGGLSLGAGGEGGSLFNQHGPVVSLAITPAAPTLVVTNGIAPAPQPFDAIATYQDSSTARVVATWSFDRPDLGLVTPAGGLLTAGVAVGGKGTLTATASGKTATTPVTITLALTENPAGASSAVKATFNTPDAVPSGTMLYPYDQTVFARGIVAPEMMWQGGSAGDVYLLHFHEAYFDAEVYASADPPSDVVLDDTLWAQLTNSNAGEPVSVDVLRSSGGKAHAAMKETWTVAQGSLLGSIYYWAVNQGQLMKIAPAAKTPTVVFDSGAAAQLGTPAPASYDGTVPPWSTGSNGNRCVACHTVSKDGSTITAIFERQATPASPWGTLNLTASPPGVVQITPYPTPAIFTALTPDGAYAVHNDLAFTMGLAGAKTGAAVASALDSIADHVADPAFSPDDKHLAFASNVSGSYPIEYTSSDLDVFDFDAATTAFTNRRTIVQGNGSAIAFPSFSPDSQWVVYQRGDYSRAKYGASSVGHDQLYIANLAKAAGEVSLATASGSGLDAQNQLIAYQPTVNPIAVGGYLWVVFVSPRDYGNKMLSVSNPTYENRKQLWVAAIDLNPTPGKDPSHPAFWLPGQDVTTINMSGYWALEPCKETGAACDQGFECCTGFCYTSASGAPTCNPPPAGCSQVGDKCASGADCCNSPTVTCVGGFCAQAQPF